MARATLTKSVLAGGRVFPAGTAREGDAAKVIPAGDWWSDDGDDASEDDGPFDPSKHNQDEVIAHLTADATDAEERERVLAVEGQRDSGTRQKIAKWVEEQSAATQGDDENPDGPPAGDSDGS